MNGPFFTNFQMLFERYTNTFLCYALHTHQMLSRWKTPSNGAQGKKRITLVSLGIQIEKWFFMRKASPVQHSRMFWAHSILVSLFVVGLTKAFYAFNLKCTTFDRFFLPLFFSFLFIRFVFSLLLLLLYFGVECWKHDWKQRILRSATLSWTWCASSSDCVVGFSVSLDDINTIN